MHRPDLGRADPRVPRADTSPSDHADPYARPAETTADAPWARTASERPDRVNRP